MVEDLEKFGSIIACGMNFLLVISFWCSFYTRPSLLVLYTEIDI